ncbi:MAG: ATP-dependent DNA helicase RecG [Candidatus Falkowbacteria bacterium]|nr:ATP-dependent DNA helicase RecG [Candidatus Falkowbacteria bacterium]
MITLASPLAELKGVGKTIVTRLKKLGLDTVQDLIFYFPFRYDRFQNAKNISDLQEGQEAQIIGQIDLINNRRSARRKMNLTEAIIQDDSGIIKVVWFNQPFIAKNLKVGDFVSLAGRVSEKLGGLCLVSPVYEKLQNYEEQRNQKLHNTQGIIPNYHLVEGLSSKQLRYLIRQVIGLSGSLKDSLPDQVAVEQKLMPLAQAIKNIHFPENELDLENARRRLGFEELFVWQLRAQMIKRQLQGRQALKIEFNEKATREFVNSLPFTLTSDQKRSAWEILLDLDKPTPMSHLLQGDVGSGKTVVAALAILNTKLANQGKTILMAPTEILAGQHFETFKKLFAAHDFKISLLTASRKEANWADGKIKAAEIAEKSELIIGTHALISDKLTLAPVALAIVDEQQRFGVKQRKKLADLNGKHQAAPHFLSLSATPIPRSLALALYGDLDLSLINQLPAGRKTVLTKIVTEKNRQAAYDFAAKEILVGRQMFVVCPLISESDKLGVKSAKEETERLKDIFPDFRISLLHGKMKSAEKEKTMRDFLEKKSQILVSTSVIEVGIDIKNANLMIVEGAERFGLSTLHQFRGRVGRGNDQAYCFLFTSSENDSPSSETAKRLESLVKYHNGRELAEADLKFRGAGETYGHLQSGFPELKIATLFDYAQIKAAQNSAEKLITTDPELKNWPRLKIKIGQFEEEVHLE